MLVRLVLFVFFSKQTAAQHRRHSSSIEPMVATDGRRAGGEWVGRGGGRSDGPVLQATPGHSNKSVTKEQPGQQAHVDMPDVPPNVRSDQLTETAEFTS